MASYCFKGHAFVKIISLILIAFLLFGCTSKRTDESSDSLGETQQEVFDGVNNESSKLEEECLLEELCNAYEFGDEYEENIKMLEEKPPVYMGEMMIRLDDSWFSDEYKNCTEHFETYSGLDELGRVGVAFANLEYDYMPKSGEIRSTDVSSIKPSGYKQKDYADLIEDVYLYNRCHLIAYSLTGETSDLKEYEYRLFTGTRQMNLAMADYEFDCVVYLKKTRNHLLYRVTPIFVGDELVARGIVVESYCVEGMGLSFDDAIYFFNVQDGVKIDYKTGDNKRA